MVPTAGELMHRFKAQPVFPIRLPEAHLAGRSESQELVPFPCPAPPHPPVPTL